MRKISILLLLDDCATIKPVSLVGRMGGRDGGRAITKAICGTITKDPAFVLFESWNEERGAENEYEEIKAENFLKLTRNINIQI